MIGFRHSGDFNNLEKFLIKATRMDYLNDLARYGQEGVSALAAATPKDSGLTAASWNYEITRSSGYLSITWTNSNINKGVPIAVIIQYGHGTGWGGYVQGTDYINPALKPVFDRIADVLWKEVTNS